MRDMGTEMTPIASEEPSRTTTPVRANTPDRNSSSRTPTPSRDAATPAVSASELESQVKTRREIMELSEQLGKTNIAAWASKAVRVREDDNQIPDQLSKIKLESRAADWEETQKSKYLDRYYNLILFLMDLHLNIFIHSNFLLEILIKCRFQRNEARIQDWENHQKTKIESEMQKIEVLYSSWCIFLILKSYKKCRGRTKEFVYIIFLYSLVIPFCRLI
jgi:Remorin, C-terminal region